MGMKAAMVTALLCAITVLASAQVMVTPTCRNHGLKGPVHIVQSSWMYDTGDGYAIGITSVEVYDTAGRLVHELEMSPDGQDDDIIHYAYDSHGRLVSESVPKQQPFVDTYHYGNDGRLVSIERKHDHEPFTEYDETLTVLKYDDQGRPAQVKWMKGSTTLYSYWPNGEIKQRSEPTSRYNAYYNERGLQDSITGSFGRSYYHYNNDGDLTAEDNHTYTDHFHSEYTNDFVDSYGNWTDRTIKESVNGSEGSTSFCRRTIIYYTKPQSSSAK